MTRKSLPFNANDAIKKYRAGQSRRVISRELGITYRKINCILRDAGITPEVRHQYLGKERISISSDEIVELFKSGQSVKSLAQIFKTSRGTIMNRLRKRGIQPRNRSESMFLRMSQIGPAGRAALTNAANIAMRGMKMPPSVKAKHALTIESRPSNQGPLEIKLKKILAEKGLTTIPQKAIGIYNCDLAADPVAVEVFCGSWHWGGNHFARLPKRIHDILDAGWHLLMLQINTHWSKALPPDLNAAANHVIAYVKKMRRRPSTLREYRVILCTGETIARGSLKQDDLTLKATLNCAHDVVFKTKRVPK